jgi:PadR family transcriptional regulator, regulatory protein AphA
MSPMIQTPLTMEHALLGFIYRQPMHGYEIQQRLLNANELGLVWRLKTSQLYALLGKLEHKGYLTFTLEPQEARPPRKIFHLTPVGQAAFLAWVSTPVEQSRAIRLEFMAKFYFARQLSPEVTATLVSCQYEIGRGRREKLQAQIEACEAGDSYQTLVYRFRLGQTEAVLAWLDVCKQVVKTSS